MADPTTITLFNAAFDVIEKVARIDNAGGDELASGYVYSGGAFAGDAPQTQTPAIYLKPEAAVDEQPRGLIEDLLRRAELLRVRGLVEQVVRRRTPQGVGETRRDLVAR